MYFRPSPPPATMLTRVDTLLSFFFFFNDTATTEIYTLSLHDALPIRPAWGGAAAMWAEAGAVAGPRSEEHTSELQSRRDLVCRLLLEKKKKDISQTNQKRKKTKKKYRQT